MDRGRPKKLGIGPPTQRISFKKLVHFSDRQLEATQKMLDHDYVLYGGAVGGGKSYWLRWAPIFWMMYLFQKEKVKNITCALFCEDYPALYDRHLSKIAFEFPAWLGRMKQGEGGRNFTMDEQFGGGTLAFRNLDDPSKYQSAEFAMVAIDELTKNPKEVFDFLRMRKRWPGISHTKFIAGTNPGSIGHGWVKKLFIDKEFEPGEAEMEQFAFVPAKAKDNPFLPETYYRQLEGLPAEWKRAYLEGDWDIFKGQVFTEWRADQHVQRPFPIPDTWRKFGCLDFGSTAPFAFYWVAMDYDKRLWVYREYYATGKNAEENAAAIMQANGSDRLEFVVADRAIFSKQGYGETIADILRRCGIGQGEGPMGMLLPSTGGTETRIARVQLMHQYLYWDTERKPKIIFFEVCRNAIRSIPQLIHDDNHPEDVDTTGDDHSYDAITYLLQKLQDTMSPQPKSSIEKKFAEMKQRAIQDPTQNDRYWKAVT